MTHTYAYKAMNSQGREVKGAVEAESEMDAAGKIKELGQFPIFLEIKGQKPNKTKEVKSRLTGALQSALSSLGAAFSDDEEPEQVDLDNVEKETVMALKLSGLGKHIVLFVCKCVKENKKPKNVIGAMGAKDTALPIQLLYEWIEDPSEENLQRLEKSLDIDIKTTIKNMEELDGESQ